MYYIIHCLLKEIMGFFQCGSLAVHNWERRI